MGRAELDAVLRVGDRQVERPLGHAQQLGGVGDRGDVQMAGDLRRAPHVQARRVGERRRTEPAELAGDVHRRLGGRAPFPQVDRHQPIVLGHHDQVGCRRVDARFVEARRAGGDRVAGDQPRSPGGVGQRVEGHHLAEHGCRRHVRAHLLEDDGGLDPAQADAPQLLGHGQAAPALVHHGPPQRRVGLPTPPDGAAHDRHR